MGDMEEFASVADESGHPPKTGLQGIVIVNLHANTCPVLLCC